MPREEFGRRAVKLGMEWTIREHVLITRHLMKQAGRLLLPPFPFEGYSLEGDGYCTPETMQTIRDRIRAERNVRAASRLRYVPLLTAFGAAGVLSALVSYQLGRNAASTAATSSTTTTSVSSTTTPATTRPPPDYDRPPGGA